jgi:replicative DNA helicase
MYFNSIQHIQAISNSSDYNETEKLEQIKDIIFKYELDKRKEFKYTTLGEQTQIVLNNITNKTPAQKVIPTQYVEIDKATGGGLIEGEYVVIGGRPGMGKTQFAVNLALNFADNVPVLFFSYDLSINALVNKFISTLSDIPFEHLQTNNLTDNQRDLAISKAEILEKKQIYMHTEYAQSIPLFVDYCEKMILEKGVKIIIIDTIQSMYSSRYGSNREMELEYISRELKQIAFKNNVIVIANTNLSKSVDSRKFVYKPKLSDLRGYGSLEQDADKVFFIYRPYYYNFSEDEEGNSVMKVVEILIAKNKSGTLQNIALESNNALTTFNNPNFDYHTTKEGYILLRKKELDSI